MLMRACAHAGTHSHPRGASQTSRVQQGRAPGSRPSGRRATASLPRQRWLEMGNSEPSTLMGPTNPKETWNPAANQTLAPAGRGWARACGSVRGTGCFQMVLD